jgi:hypothetical protein
MSNLEWLSASECVNFARLVYPRALAITVQKSIVGMAASGALYAVAGTLDECVAPLEGGIGKRDLGVKDNESVPLDFWRYEHATGRNSSASFQSSSFAVCIETTADELPYRFRRVVDGETHGGRCRLSQSASGVQFDGKQFEALISDPNWQRWTKAIDENERINRRGVLPRWKWDEVKARITVQASLNASLITSGVQPIVTEMVAAFKMLYNDDHPELTDIYRYARLVEELARPITEEAPCE